MLQTCLLAVPPAQNDPTGHKLPAAELPYDELAAQYLPGAAVQFVQFKAPELAAQPL